MNLIAKASQTIDAPIDRVWKALITPQDITQSTFGTTARSDFKEGSPITWKGEWQGRAYEDTVTIDLTSNGHGTVISLAQRN